MIKQLIYVVIVLVAALILYRRSKEPDRMLLALAILITPWQGGFWIPQLAQDLYLSVFIFLFLFFRSFAQIGSLPVKRVIYYPVLIVTVLMIVGAIFSASTALNKIQANRGIYSFFERHLMFFCVYAGIQKPKDAKYVLGAFFTSIGFQGLLAAVQFRIHFFRIGVIDELSGVGYWRATGTFFHANAFGMFLAVIIPLAFRMFMIARREKRRFAKYFYGSVMIFALIGLIACQNRGSWYGFSIAMVAVILFDLVTNVSGIRTTMTKVFIPMILVMLVLFIFMGDTINIRLFESDAEVQMEGRQLQAQEAKQLIKQFPVFGVGYQNYREHITWEFVHNLYLIIMSELGYYGFTCFILLMLIWLYNIIRGLISKNYMIVNLSLGMVTSMIVFLIASIAGPGYHLLGSKLGNHIWMLVGFTAALVKLDRHYNRRRVDDVYRQRNMDSDKYRETMTQLRERWLDLLVKERQYGRKRR